ncbi:uncharacterized protein LOC133297303 [Gastrolobium bilobum]|uniref:uncharacterized protein LOC133297303 n=1 Tax=Gastrolobium bilobum TaxID=150636 RepID=UPI002AB0B4E3|nr:uncharacterized protein LOC133297303 [Gastrolobium bilobum]
MADHNNNEDIPPEQNFRTLAAPFRNRPDRGVILPPVAPNFELKPIMFYMIKEAGVFNGLPAEDPNIESHLGQIVANLQTRAPGSLPGDTDVPSTASTASPKEVITLPSSPSEKIKVVTLRSGKTTTQPTTLHEEEEHNKASEATSEEEQQQPATDEQNPQLGKEVETNENQVDRSQTISPTQSKQIPAKILFPQRTKKQQDDKQFGKFLDILKQLHINIPLVDALEQMLRYVKFMKDVLSKKRGITEYETVKMTQESCQYLGKLPPKLQDLGSFSIPCIIGNTYQGKALCDLGASINLMPLSVFKQLSTGPAKPTTVTLQMANRSIVKPEGKIEDLQVKVDKFILPADFIILDYEADVDVPIILGRPFLAIGGAVINVQKRGTDHESS